MKFSRSVYIEIFVHILFWVFIFSAVNVEWNTDWFDRSIRPKRPAPLSIIIFPIVFYLNAFWAIPRYLNPNKWPKYILLFGLIFIIPEFIRSAIISELKNEVDFLEEFKSRDSFLLGSPNVFWMALTFSFGYRFTKDWFINQRPANKEESLDLIKNIQNPILIVSPEEAEDIKNQLNALMVNQKPYNNPSLGLRDLAEAINTTEKKLSFVLNQFLHTSFYDYLNFFRVEEFIEKVKEGLLDELSIAGIANLCGFNSKSSFYRAFKKETGMTPTEFIKKNIQQ